MFTNRKTLKEIKDISNEQNVALRGIQVTAEQHSELLHKHDKMLDTLVGQGADNTANLKYHIKRTDILQSRQHKIIMLCSVGLGAAGVYFGPIAYKFLLLLV